MTRKHDNDRGHDDLAATIALTFLVLIPFLIVRWAWRAVRQYDYR
jgi:hypothetical protein